jgi:hypothetical protein
MTKTFSESCGAYWLGGFWRMPLCNDCRAEQLMDEQMRHREAPTDEEIDSMYALAGSDSNEYRTAHD